MAATAPIILTRRLAKAIVSASSLTSIKRHIQLTPLTVSHSTSEEFTGLPFAAGALRVSQDNRERLRRGGPAQFAAHGTRPMDGKGNSVKTVGTWRILTSPSKPVHSYRSPQACDLRLPDILRVMAA